ncbi:positive regulator of purine utilization [Aspergillus udagawae]|uniref:Positive regulator of purine utilization n=1 Tax=Aspergillus udagawae TaxID=91492 RepID=A0A8H3SE96_9EURO|nr:uncharacterized protein Aud_000045 [Aspergillus udagawae]GFF57864.1 positive regulator of purine utilization [Aspergillus udagawae]GIC84231.1 hypothetical protein Aud_000045 [Aspergillus udagawae]
MQHRIRWLESIVRENCSNIDLGGGPDVQVGALDETAHPGLGTPDEPAESHGQHSQPPSQPFPQEIRVTLTEDDPTGTIPREQAASLIVPSNNAADDEPQQAHEIGLVSLSPGGDPRYIGPSSGYFFAKRILSGAGCRGRQKAAPGASWESTHISVELLNTPALLPPRKESAVELSAGYFQTVHLLHPFLHEQSHMKLIDRVYASQEERPLDSFQVYMVLAIAALNLSRQCKIHLPVEGYYASALKYADYACNHGSMTSLQCLLLLMVYALYNPSCNINIWNLNYQCLASVIDLGLQRDVRASPSLRISVFDQEMRTRIFWVVYTFDRTVCTMMGRPIGIRDEACDIRFPLAISDSDLINIGPDQQYKDSPSHMSYSIHIFRLAKLISEMKYVMHSVNRGAPAYAYPPVRDIVDWQKDMIKSLQDWHSGIPQQVSGVNGEMPLLCKIKYHDTMILLLRPSPGIPNPSDENLEQCFQQAIMLLQGFGDLYGTGHLLYSRLVVHSVFLGTLAMLYCIWRLPQTATKIPVDDLITKFNIAQNILSSIGEHWAEATRARDCIHELSSITIRRLLKSLPTITANSQPVKSFTPHPQHGEIQGPESEFRPTQQPYQLGTSQGQPFLDVHGRNAEPWLAQPHTTSEDGVSNFSNLFDDLLQGDFPGWSGTFDIDELMGEIFNSAPH